MPDVVFTPLLTGDAEDQTSRLKEFLSYASGRLEGWTTKLSAMEGDLYIFWFGAPAMAIRGVGVCCGDVEVHDNSDGKYDWTKAKKVYFADYEPFFLLDKPIVLTDIRMDKTLASWWASRPFQGAPKTMLKDPDAARRLVGLIAERNPATKKLLAPFFGAASPPKRTHVPRPRDLTKLIDNALGRLDPPQRERIRRILGAVLREPTLRGDVLALWGGKCAACGLEMRAESNYECEVTHIRPVEYEGNDSLRNALPLCRTHHWAFDNYVWAIRPALSIDVRKEFRNVGPMKALHGKRLGAPIGKKSAASLLGLPYVKWRWSEYKRHRGSR